MNDSNKILNPKTGKIGKELLAKPIKIDINSLKTEWL